MRSKFGCRYFLRLHTRSLVTPGCFTTTVHRGSQVQVRGALSTRHCGLICTLSAQRACCVCLRYARLRFPCSRCVHLLFVSCAVVRALAVHSRAARLRAGSVVHLCRVLPDCAASARQRRRHRGGAPARALSWRACLGVIPAPAGFEPATYRFLRGLANQ